MKRSLLALSLAVALTAPSMADTYHAHLSYVQLSGVKSFNDSDYNPLSVNGEMQAQMTSDWLFRGGYSQGKEDDIEYDEIYATLGYILADSGSTAHIIEIGGGRTELDVNYDAISIQTGVDQAGIGYRFWWHLSRRWESEFDVTGWFPLEDDYTDDSFVWSTQLRMNYYVSDHWGFGGQYRYSEYGDNVGLYVRYVF